MEWVFKSFFYIETSKRNLTLIILLLALFASNKIFASSPIEVANELCKAGKKQELEVYLIQIKKSSQIKINEINPFFDLCDCLFKQKIFNETLIDLLLQLSKKEAYFEREKGIDILQKIGKTYYRERNYKEAKIFFTKALGGFNLPLTPFSKKGASIYCDLGLANKKLGDIESAIGYFEKANLIYTKIDGINSESLGKNYLDYAECYTLAGDYKKAQFILIQAKEILKKHKNDVELSKCYNQIAANFVQLEEFDKAISNLKKSLSIRSSIYGVESMQVGMIYDFIGNAYLFKGEYKNAANYYQAYLDIINKKKKDHKYRKYLPYKIGACYTNLQDFNRAAAYIDSSLFLLNFDPTKLHPYENLASPIDMIMILYFKGKNFLKAYEVYHCEEDLFDAAKWYGLSARLVEYNSMEFEEEDSKQYLLDRFYYVFETTIDAYSRLYNSTHQEAYADSVLCYMEKSRAILLKEAMQRAAALDRVGIPDSLLQAERRTYKEILALENERHSLMISGKPGEENPSSLELASHIFDLKTSRRKLLKQIETLHPAFFRNNYASPVVKISAVRKNLLRSEEAALQYFIGDDYLFVMVLEGSSCRIIRQSIPDSLIYWVKTLRDAVYAFALAPADTSMQAYVKSAHALYKCLVAPLGTLPQRLLVVPDGVLEYLPFEALLTSQVNQVAAYGYSSCPYLLKRHSLRYAHSLAVLEQQKPLRPRYRRVLALAPDFEDSEPPEDDDTNNRKRYLGALNSNVKEIRNISRLFPARLLIGSEASLDNFEQAAGNYSVLHLATHAKANDEEGEYSYLAFRADSSGRLYAKNLYALPLRAELVVLSACETGIGELRRGEGIVSLARGFSYAGANSLVTTLWRVGDRESADLMGRFYKFLKRRLDKDEALRQAQLEFLNEHQTDSRSHPFFWAAFVTIGDAAPLSIPGRWDWLRWALPLALLLGVAGWIWKRA